MKLIKLLIAFACGFAAIFGLVPDCSGAVRTEEPNIENLLDAIAIIESNNEPNCIGDNGLARGTYQIHKAYWRDSCKFLGVKWLYLESFNPEKSRAIVRAYLLHYGKGKSIEAMARIHNAGPNGDKKKCTDKYWNKVKAVMKKQSAEKCLGKEK